MPLKRTSLAAVAAILLLAGSRVRADDGKIDPSKDGPGPSSEQVKGILNQAFEMVQAAGAQPIGGAPPPGFPGQVVVVAALPKDVQADAIRQIGRARARLGDRAGARQAWQSALDAAAEVAYNPGARSTICIAIARAQLEAGERDEARFTLRQALQTARSVAGQSGMMMPGVVVSPLAANPVAKKVDLLRRIAQVQVEAGDADGARDLLRQADADARTLAKPLERIGALLKIAAADGRWPSWPDRPGPAPSTPRWPRRTSIPRPGR